MDGIAVFQDLGPHDERMGLKRLADEAGVDIADSPHVGRLVEVMRRANEGAIIEDLGEMDFPAPLKGNHRNWRVKWLDRSPWETDDLMNGKDDGELGAFPKAFVNAALDAFSSFTGLPNPGVGRWLIMRVGSRNPDEDIAGKGLFHLNDYSSGNTRIQNGLIMTFHWTNSTPHEFAVLSGMPSYRGAAFKVMQGDGAKLKGSEVVSFPNGHMILTNSWVPYRFIPFLEGDEPPGTHAHLNVDLDAVLTSYVDRIFKPPSKRNHRLSKWAYDKYKNEHSEKVAWANRVTGRGRC